MFLSFELASSIKQHVDRNADNCRQDGSKQYSARHEREQHKPRLQQNPRQSERCRNRRQNGIVFENEEHERDSGEQPNNEIDAEDNAKDSNALEIPFLHLIMMV